MSVKNVEVRFARKGDISWLMRNIRHLQKVDAVYDILKHRITVAVIGRQKVGCLRLESWGLWFPSISATKVNEDFRRLGIGRKLLAFTESYLYRKGKRVLLSSSTQGEKLSADWHRKMGFKKSGRFKSLNGQGIDEIFYIKKIKMTSNPAKPIGRDK